MQADDPLESLLRKEETAIPFVVVEKVFRKDRRRDTLYKDCKVALVVASDLKVRSEDLFCLTEKDLGVTVGSCLALARVDLPTGTGVWFRTGV